MAINEILENLSWNTKPIEFFVSLNTHKKLVTENVWTKYEIMLYERMKSLKLKERLFNGKTIYYNKRTPELAISVFLSYHTPCLLQKPHQLKGHMS